MAVLTLVPKALVELEATETRPKGVDVRIVPFVASPMRRQFHVVVVRDMALVNTHLESCLDGARARKDQFGEIGRAVKSEGREARYGVFGDLNWQSKTHGWLTHVPHTLDVKQVSARRYPSISLTHTLRTFLVE